MRRHTLNVCLILIILFGFVFFAHGSSQGSYHQFADKRMFINTPNFLNVISNSLFLIPSFLGIEFLRSKNIFLKDRYKSIVCFAFFLCIGLITIGSALYYLNPSTDSLMWRRLPIAMSLASLSAIMVTERINDKAGFFLLFPLLLAGGASVIYWEYRGDLRWYRFIELLPFLYCIPYILFPPLTRYKHSYLIVLSLVWIILAHLSGFYDHTVYRITGWLFSGHTIEHVFSVLAGMAVYRYAEENISSPS